METSLNFASALITNQWVPISSLRTEKPPAFIEALDNSSWSPCSTTTESIVNIDLNATLKMFYRISRNFDMHFESKQVLNSPMIHHSMSYMQSALLELRHQRLDNVSNCVYLGLLTLVAATFRLPGVYQHPCCTILNELVEASIVKLDSAVLTLPREMKYWLVTIFAISTTTFPNIIFGHSITELRKLSWEEVRQHLRQVFWISAFHDDLGQMAHDKLCA